MKGVERFFLAVMEKYKDFRRTFIDVIEFKRQPIRSYGCPPKNLTLLAENKAFVKCLLNTNQWIYTGMLVLTRTRLEHSDLQDVGLFQQAPR
jgi:hypothetical protein